MPISVKKSGAYASAPLFYVKKSGTYSPAQGVYVKRNGVYSNASSALFLDFTDSSRTLDSRVTFSRASNATMTGNDGLLRYGRHNLLTYSEQFDNAAWTKTRCSITANTSVAPDGALTGDKLVEDTTASASHPVSSASVSISIGATVSVSVYAKAAERTAIVLRANSGSDGIWGAYNLSTGAVGSVVNSGTGSGATATIQSVGNGWYRCVLTGVVSTTANNAAAVVYPAVSTTDPANTSIIYTGDGASGLFLWGAQLEINRNASVYVPTTTAAVYGPRFDYDPITLAARGLLIEEQRANLILYSEQLDNAAWSALGPITANAAVAPNGITTADKLSDPSDTYTGYAYQTVTVTAGTDYVMSAFVKAGDATTGRIALVDPTLGFSLVVYADFDLSAGTISAPTNVGGTWTGATSSITAAGNGWYRVTVGAKLVGNTSVNAALYTSASYIGQGIGFYIWGAQIEAGTFATSYIPTTSATATRSADSVTLTGTNFSSWYNQTEGAFVVKGLVPPNLAAFPYIYAASDGSQNNQIGAYAFTNGVYTSIRTGGVAQGAVGVVSTPAVGAQFKFATAYQFNNAVSALNGTLGTVDTTVDVPTVNQFRIGATGLGTQFNNACIQQLVYYPNRLSDADLRALTT